MAESLSAATVIRVSRVVFDPSLYPEVAAADKRTSEYLIPAIKRLPGFIHWFGAVSPEGSFVQVSLWDSEEHAKQMDGLKEMFVDARGEFREVGVDFSPEYATIVNYPITWTI